MLNNTYVTQVTIVLGTQAAKELSRLKLYLAELPTKDEYNELSNKLVQAEEEIISSREHIDSLVDERAHLQQYVLFVIFQQELSSLHF